MQLLWQSRNGRHFKWKVPKPFSFGSQYVCHAHWQHDGWTNWWTYPFFMVSTLVTHKYKWKERVIGVYGSQLHKFESNNREKWALTVERKEEEGDLLASLPESLSSSQHHVVLPNKASQQCCTVEHKTNLLPRLITMQAWFTSGEDPSGIQNKTLKRTICARKYSGNQSHPAQHTIWAILH